MTTYVYHIPHTLRNTKMTEALKGFLRLEDFQVIDSLELTTDQRAVATVIESLFGVTPELRPDDDTALQERLDQWTATREAIHQVVEDYLETVEEEAVVAHVADEQPAAAGRVRCPHCHNEMLHEDFLGHDCPALLSISDVPTPAGMKRCPECNELFNPDNKRQKYCSPTCAQRVYNRNHQAKKASRAAEAAPAEIQPPVEPGSNGNGHQPAQVIDQAPIAVVEPPAQPEPDPIIDLINADVIANQTMRWLIASSGKEVESVTDLIARGKLTPGERLHHKTKGWWEVFLNDMGVPDLRKVE